MTEIIFIILQIFLFTFLFSLKIFKISSKYYNLSILENISTNTLFHINVILFLSFLNFNLSKIINIYFILIAIICILNIYFYKFNKKNFDYNNFQIYFLVFACFILFVDIAFNLHLSWDAEKFWFDKTLNFYHNNSLEQLKNLGNSHYPHLGSLIWSFFWKVSPIEHEYSGRLFVVFLYLTSIFLLTDLLKTSLINKLIILIFFIFLTYDYYIVFSGNNEIFIFSLICIVMNFFYRLLNSNKKNKNFYIILILLSCNLLIWFKQEGLIYSGIIVLTLLLFFDLEIKKKFVILGIYLALLLIRLLVFKYYNFDLFLTLTHNFSIVDIINNISLIKIFLISKYFILAFLKNYLLSIGLIIFILSLQNRKFFSKIYYIYFFASLCFLFVFLAYLLTNFDVDFMLKTGIDRLIYSFSPFIFLLFVEYFNFFKIKDK